MKVLVVGDIHFSQYSSILRKRGSYFSRRLENCINSVNWVEQVAEENECDRIIYLGDFFDRADLNAEEISALKEIQWSNIPHELIVGNHELGSANGEYSSAQVLNLLPGFKVIAKPELDVGYGRYFLYLPYIFESERKPILEYFKKCISSDFVTQEVKRLYVFSHNDLKGVNYGAFESKEGFELSDIQESGAVFFNGHIHNGQDLFPKVINVGNLTGQNFNEDASRYKHRVLLLDTRTESISSIVNPYAYNFYKEEVATEKDITSLVSSLGSHAVLSVKCKESLVDNLKSALTECSKVEDFRIVTVVENKEMPVEETPQFIATDHLVQFRDYVLDKLGSNEYLLKELQEVANVI